MDIKDIVAIFALALFGCILLFTFLSPVILKNMLTTCTACKAKKAIVPASEDMFFAIPCHLDDKYDDPEKYLQKNMRPLFSFEQLALGQRYCRVKIMQCQKCGARQVSIKDVLNVRGQESVQQEYLFPYAGFAQFFETQPGNGGTL